MLHRVVILSFLISSAALASVPSPASQAMVTQNRDATEFVDRLVSSSVWQKADPTWSVATSFSVKRFHFGTVTVVRVTPQVFGVVVEGADRVIRLHDGNVVSIDAEKPLHLSGRFSLTAQQAEEIAFSKVPRSLFTAKSMRHTAGLAKAVWRSYGEGFRPAWRVRVPTLKLEDLRDLWIDADNGNILASRPIAKFQVAPSSTPTAPTAAKVFNPAPAASGVTATDLADVELNDLLPAASGGYLKGYHFETFNCCKYYTCSGGQAECLPADRICVDKNTTGAITSRVPVALPTASLPFDLSLMGFTGDTLYLETVFCTEQPRLKSAGSPAGWFPTPVDSTRDQSMSEGLDSEEDSFAELQIYWATQTYFSHLREVLKDNTFCLKSSSMQCETDGSATMSISNPDSPSHPYHLTANLLMPSLDFMAVLTQLQVGKGGSASNPIIIDDYQRFGNAAFVPAMDNSGVGVPPELGPIAEIFSRPYDFNLYAQGDRDFGYDGDVVFHEFTHATIHTYIPHLASFGADEWGAYADPGAMNEGWSDYFAASYTNDALTGEYAGGGGIRSADNADSCPSALIGEVHQDSLPWSGALWDIRKGVVAALGDTAVNDLDSLLLSTLAQSVGDEQMSQQAVRIESALNASAVFDSTIVDIAHKAFLDHGIIDCARIWKLSTVGLDNSLLVNTKETLMQPSATEVGLDQVGSVLQFELNIPSGMSRFIVTWSQGGGGMMGLGGGQGPAPVAALVNASQSVRWSYLNGAATVKSADGTDLTEGSFVFSEHLATLGNGDNRGNTPASYTFEIAPVTDTDSTFYVSFVTQDQSVNFSNISVSIPLQQPQTGGDVEGEGASASGSVSQKSKQSSRKLGCAAQQGGTTYPLGFLFVLFLLGRSRQANTCPLAFSSKTD